MGNKEIAQIFDEMGSLLQIKGENPFKIRAYQNAVRIIEDLGQPLRELYERDELKTIDGFGKAITEKTAEFFETGKVSAHEKLKGEFPEGILDLLKVNGMGPKTVKLVYEELGVSSIDDLKQAAEAGKLQSLPKMGKKSEEKILKGIANVQQSSGRFTLGVAAPIARSILERVKAVKGVWQADIAGSLRRGRETVGDVDILVSAKNAEAVMQEFLATENIRDVLAQGATKSSILLECGLQVDLRVVEKDAFGAALQYFTGSKEHNVKLRERAVKQKLKVNEYGVYETGSETLVAGKTEESVYQCLGLAWVPPELREGRDEIQQAQNGTLPELIEAKHIRSALHNHTTDSDGFLSLEELANQAKARGYAFIAVTDHSGSLGVANGLSPERLKRQIEQVREFNETVKGIEVLAGTEVDIRADGRLDFDDDLLKELDVVIASVHASFEQLKDKMTARILRAIENPYVDIIAHPTGRLIGRRPPIEFDEEAVFAKAAETQTVMEINCYPARLDLNDVHIRQAKAHGVLFSINTDTHKVEHFDHLELGVKMARRGGLSADNVINSMTCKQYLSWKKKKTR
ncbi:MAG: DNA polymerase/3'-5' exonuclease PolX [Candidatus Hinthialibacter antarcticus]|nr:DNA polymerase/3'-5' exonuclease PolX [Candidatus Hinthialibacter antarcticus]